MAPTVSLWDCGEFIATSHGLQVGHPPGAPFYQLLAHLFTLLAPDAEHVAWWSNLLSALAAGATVMLLYWIILLLLRQGSTAVRRIAAAVGAASYAVCDTAWFSAVESEVYALAMLMAALIVFCALLWYRSTQHDARLLVLAALLTGLAVCVHLMCLLVLPAVALLIVAKLCTATPETTPATPHRKGHNATPTKTRWWQTLWTTLWQQPRRTLTVTALCIAMFVIGLTPYLIVPIRAAAGTPINCGNPSTPASFADYVERRQYVHAPVYPRIWRHDGHHDRHAATWSGNRNDLLGQLTYYATYQLGYMYGRYLMWNFAGRQNTVAGYGGAQDGQFATGIPPIDRLLVGNGTTPPSSLPGGRAVYFLLPLLLGIIGIVYSRNGRLESWTVWLLFLMGGIVLNIYLNHPAYEPRERDYAYVLSFMAFSIWIAMGVAALCQWAACLRPQTGTALAALMLAVPLLMACQNWPSHDRHLRHTPRDIACNLLGSCPSGALLIAYGDNDTFPLWYLQQVEQRHRDIEFYNINLIGYQRFFTLMARAEADGRPVYLTHYAQSALKDLYPDRLKLAGYVYRLGAADTLGVDATAAYEAMTQRIAWHEPPAGYMDDTERHFITTYWADVTAVAQQLLMQGDTTRCDTLLRKTCAELPPRGDYGLPLIAQIASLCHQTGVANLASRYDAMLLQARNEQQHYYSNFAPSYSRYASRRLGELETARETPQE